MASSERHKVPALSSIEVSPFFLNGSMDPFGEFSIFLSCLVAFNLLSQREKWTRFVRMQTNTSMFKRFSSRP